MYFSAAVVAALASVAAALPPAPSAPTPTATASDPADVYKAQATALTESPTSKVKGRVFDRYVSIVGEKLSSPRLGCRH
jgi:acid phosphatase